MGTWYGPEIFAPSEKQILFPTFFHDGYFAPPLGFLTMLSYQPAKRLCATCVIFLFGADKASVGRVTHYLVYAFFCDVQAAFGGVSPH